EYTSARRIFKRLLRFTLICQVIHHRFDAFIFAFLEAKLSIKDDIAILGDIARSVGQVKVFCFDDLYVSIAVNDCRPEQNILYFAAIRSRIHKQRAADRSWYATCKLKPCQMAP